MMGAPKQTSLRFNIINQTDSGKFAHLRKIQKHIQVSLKQLVACFVRHLHTLFTRTDIEQARAEAVTSRHTEACVGWVHGQIGKHLIGGNETIPRDPLHCHVLRMQSVQRPKKQSHMQSNRENTNNHRPVEKKRKSCKYFI